MRIFFVRLFLITIASLLFANYGHQTIFQSVLYSFVICYILEPLVLKLLSR